MAETRNAGKKLQKDFEVVVKDAKELIEAASGDANAKTKAALAKLEESLENAKHKFEVMEGNRINHCHCDIRDIDYIIVCQGLYFVKKPTSAFFGYG